VGLSANRSVSLIKRWFKRASPNCAPANSSAAHVIAVSLVWKWIKRGKGIPDWTSRLLLAWARASRRRVVC